MKAIALAAAAIATTSPGAAQTLYNPGVASVLGSGGGPAAMAGVRDRSALSDVTRDTPTMHRQRLRWAVALRERARRFQREDGGVISDRHARYIRREVQRLLYD